MKKQFITTTTTTLTPKKMFGLLAILSLALASAMGIPEPAREPWSTSDDYFKVVERGFRLDSMPITFTSLKKVR